MSQRKGVRKALSLTIFLAAALGLLLLRAPFKTGRFGPELAPTHDRLNRLVQTLNQAGETGEPLDAQRVAEMRADIEEILARDPLNSRAVLLAARLEEANNSDSAAQIETMKIAHRRNLRDANSGLALLGAALAQRDCETYVKKLSLLWRTERTLRDDLVGSAALAYLDPQCRPVLLAEAKAGAPWGVTFARSRLRATVPERLPDLAPLIWDAARGPGQRALRERYLLDLSRHGHLKFALSLWHRSIEAASDIRQSNLRQWVHNPDLQPDTALPPFAWQTYENAERRAELVNDQGMTITFRGAQRGILARQIMPLPADFSVSEPVPITLRWNARRFGAPGDGRLAWRMLCAGGGQYFMDAPIDDGEGSAQAFIPAGCDMIELRLYPVPGLYTSRLRYRIDRAEIIPGH